MVAPKDPGYDATIFSKSPCMARLQEGPTDETLCWTNACLEKVCHRLLATQTRTGLLEEGGEFLRDPQKLWAGLDELPPLTHDLQSTEELSVWPVRAQCSVVST